MKKQFLTEKDVASNFSIALQTLRNWRFLKIGPPYYKVGRKVLYRDEEVFDFIEKSKVVVWN